MKLSSLALVAAILLCAPLLHAHSGDNDAEAAFRHLSDEALEQRLLEARAEFIESRRTSGDASSRLVQTGTEQIEDEKRVAMRNLMMEMSRRQAVKREVVTVLPERNFDSAGVSDGQRAYLQKRYELLRAESIALNQLGPLNREEQETARRQFRETHQKQRAELDTLRNAMVEEQELARQQQEADPAYLAQREKLLAEREHFRHRPPQSP